MKEKCFRYLSCLNLTRWNSMSSKKTISWWSKTFFLRTSEYVPGQRNSELTVLPEPMQHWICPILKKRPPRGHGSHCSVVYILFNPWTRLLGTRGSEPTWTRGELRILHRKQITGPDRLMFDGAMSFEIICVLAGTYSSLTTNVQHFLFYFIDDYSEKSLSTYSTAIDLICVNTLNAMK